ncbi:MAG: hypothetical protein A2201_13215 [Alicyclobacillus sp. RIFOXYA1_FULL_53_8]|nr:MAG: hypothetical protein A2201_13215 [Alicyclobacillus sp. RIFOXYA1_FULL_53_8]
MFVLSTFAGFQRRFAAQSGFVMAKILSLVVGVVAFWLAWKGSQELAKIALSGQLANTPTFVRKVADAWQQAPNVAQLIAFALVYWLVSGSLNQVLQRSSMLVVRFIPRFLGASRMLGAVLGAMVGIIRGVLVGAAVFLVLQYLSVPALQAQAASSRLYGGLRQMVYEPYLSPIVKQEMPVLAKSAFLPLAQNINLFVLPSGTAGEQRGVLVVPKEIASLAQQITAKDKTARQKAYSLYEWEIHHIHYDWKKYNDYVSKNQWDQQSPLQTLQTGTGVCADYALLYADLAHAVGLTVQIDEGQGGTSPANVGSHAWNKVLDPVTQHWITVDTTWGSEQDAWFDAAHFNSTHFQQTSILIAGSGY